MEQFKETLELFDFALGIKDAIKKSLEDGVVNGSDFPNFIPTVVKAPNALAGINLILSENLTASEEQIAMFHNNLAERFSLENKNVEVLAEQLFIHGVGMALALAKFEKAKDSNGED